MKFLKILSLVLITNIVFAQDKKNEMESSSIEMKFDELYKKSSSYQKYKVIDKIAYSELKQYVLISLKKLENTIDNEKKDVTKLNDESTKLNNEIKNLKEKLDTSIAQENKISFLGIDLNKINYNIIVWSIISILIASLMFFIYKYKDSNSTTKRTQITFDEIEQEFELHKKKSIEKEQQLRRKLQDEINKQRGV
ncbi:hypothetical protein [Tenacibaculum sp. C7A-26P2]|uniref:hypothetical protein n=1 Tax=Tenacibaculum sp. C7A-26P2 TaxID=3447504 RepID=UPI003F824BCD